MNLARPDTSRMRCELSHKWRGSNWPRFLALAAAWFLAGPTDAADRLVSGRGSEARTLLVYSESHVPYCLADLSEMVALRLGRVKGTINRVALDALTTNHLASAEYLVVFCPQPPPPLPPLLLESITRTNLDVLWIGQGADQLLALTNFAGAFRPASDPGAYTVTNLVYRGQDWSIPPTYFAPLEVQTNLPAQVLLEGTVSTNQPRLSLGWRLPGLTFFGAVPWEGTVGNLFGDMLLDFYGVKEIPRSQVFIRLEGYNPRSNHARFQRLVDLFYARQLPFLVSVVPAIEVNNAGEVADLDSSPEFVQSLHYAQQRGGRLIVRGYLQPGSGKAEFWNLELDRPMALDQPAYARERLSKSLPQFIRHGLLPLAWETPEYAASRTAYAEIARFFSTGVERLQLSDATHLEMHTPSSITADAFARLILPENLGYIPEDSPDPAAAMRRRAQSILPLRATVAGCHIHAYLPFDTVAALIDGLENLQQPFLDPLRLSHWVRWPGGLLLTGQAQHPAAVAQGTLRWKAFDDRFRLVGEASDPIETAGERILKRRGVGVIELFEFKEYEP